MNNNILPKMLEESSFIDFLRNSSLPAEMNSMGQRYDHMTNPGYGFGGAVEGDAYLPGNVEQQPRPDWLEENSVIKFLKGTGLTEAQKRAQDEAEMYGEGGPGYDVYPRVEGDANLPAYPIQNDNPIEQRIKAGIANQMRMMGIANEHKDQFMDDPQYQDEVMNDYMRMLRSMGYTE